MNIVESDVGAIGILAPHGALVGEDAAALRSAGLDALRRRRGRIILDLAAVPYADSAGLETLLDLTDALAESGRILRLVQPSETLRTALGIVGLLDRFEIHADATAAARSFL